MSFNEPGMPGSVSPPATSTDWSAPYPPDDFGGHGDVTTDATTSGTGTQGTKDVAKQEAGNVAQSASGAAQQVAGITKEQAANVASDAKDQAKRLAGQTRQELSQQASTGKDRAVTGLRSLSSELRGMTERSEESGPATQLARQASNVTEQIADFVEQREPGQLLDEVRDFARRRPGAFLLGAALAGVVVGRLTRGAVSSAKNSDSPQSGQGNGSSTYGTRIETPATPAYGMGTPTEFGTPASLPETTTYGESSGGDLYGQATPSPYPYSGDEPGSVTR